MVVSAITTVRSRAPLRRAEAPIADLAPPFADKGGAWCCSRRWRSAFAHGCPALVSPTGVRQLRFTGGGIGFAPERCPSCLLHLNLDLRDVPFFKPARASSRSARSTEPTVAHHWWSRDKSLVTQVRFGRRRVLGQDRGNGTGRGGNDARGDVPAAVGNVHLEAHRVGLVGGRRRPIRARGARCARGSTETVSGGGGAVSPHDVAAAQLPAGLSGGASACGRARLGELPCCMTSRRSAVTSSRFANAPASPGN
jgi:hypothetical protein